MPFRKSKPWGNVKPPVGSVIDWGDPINALLSGCWLLNEGAGSIAKDVAKVNNGTLVTGSLWPWAPVQSGLAPNFTAGTNRIDCGNPVPLQISGAMTLSLWMLGTGGGAGNNGGIGKLGGSGARGYALVVNNGTTVSFFVATNATTLVSTTEANHSTTTITHYSAVYIPSTSITIYRNGVQISQNTTSIPASQFSTSNSFQIGDRGDGGGGFTGKIWNVRVYARALAQTELRRLYSEPFAGIVAPRRRIISAVAATPTFNAGWATGATSSVLGGVT